MAGVRLNGRMGYTAPMSESAHAKAIASSTLWQVASQVVMALLSIITIKLVVTGLSQEMFGQYNTAYGYLQIFGILADFGLYAVSVREVSRQETEAGKETMLGALIVLRVAVTLVSLGGAVLIAFLLPQWRGTPLPLGIAAASLVPGLTLLAGVLRTVFQVKYKMHYVFIAEVLQRVLTVSLTAGLVALGARRATDTHTYLAFLLVGGAGSLLLFALSAVFAARLMRIRLTWDREALGSLLRLAAPYGFAFLCTALYRQFDVTMIGLLRPDHAIQNAFYGAVQRMMDMAYLFPTFLLNSALPLLSARHGKGEDTRKLLGMTLFAVLLLGLTAFLFSVFWARPLVALLTAPDYLSSPGHPGSDTALRLLSVSMLMNGIIVYCFYTLLTVHRWKPLVGTLLVGVALSLVSNLVLVPRLGFVGASITSVLTHTTLALLLLPQSLRILPARMSAAQARSLILYAALLAGFLFLARPFLTGNLPTVLGLATAAVWMGAVAWALRIPQRLRG
jgi:O-antigen/teichoic acid export membrane protein